MFWLTGNKYPCLQMNLLVWLFIFWCMISFVQLLNEMFCSADGWNVLFSRWIKSFVQPMNKTFLFWCMMSFVRLFDKMFLSWCMMSFGLAVGWKLLFGCLIKCFYLDAWWVLLSCWMKKFVQPMDKKFCSAVW
jgi:hypothetical protein